MWIRMVRVAWYFSGTWSLLLLTAGTVCWGLQFQSDWNNSSNNKKLLLLHFTWFWLLCCLNLWVRFYSTVRVDMLNIWKMFVQNYTSGKLATDLLSLTPPPSSPEMPTSHHNPNQTTEGEKEAGLQVLKISACSKKRREYSPLFISLPFPSSSLSSVEWNNWFVRKASSPRICDHWIKSSSHTCGADIGLLWDELPDRSLRTIAGVILVGRRSCGWKQI